MNAATNSLSGLKVTLSQPVCVTRSTNWLWFPAVYRLSNGDLAALMFTAFDGDPNDSAATACWSADGGLTWSAPASNPVVSYSTLRLNNGDTVLLPYLPQLSGENDLVGPCGVISNGQRTIVRHDGAVTVTNFPRLVRREALYGGRFVFNGQTLRLTNGLHHATMYGLYEGATRMSVVSVVSENGFDWRVQATIADDACPLPGNDGPSETTTVRLPDGRLMNVFRLASSVLYGQSWSSDEGLTWTAPVNMSSPKSVEPSMMAMSNGVVALSGGRPGLRLWLDWNGDGQSWQSVNIRTHHNQFVPAEPISDVEGINHQTSGYTELAMLDETNLLMIYDRIPNGHIYLPPAGDSNSVWVVRVTVERVASAWSGTITHAGRADPTTEAPAWTYAFSGSPSVEGGSETTASGAYDFWKIAGAGAWAVYDADPTALDMARNWTMEVRVRVPLNEYTFYQASFYVADGTDVWYLGFDTDAGQEGLYYADSSGSYDGTRIKAMDVHSDYHTYKMAMQQGATDAEDQVGVYVDGVLARTLTRADVLDYPYPRDVGWGDGSSYLGKSVDVRFNYVKFDGGAKSRGAVFIIR